MRGRRANRHQGPSHHGSSRGRIYWSSRDRSSITTTDHCSPGGVHISGVRPLWLGRNLGGTVMPKLSVVMFLAAFVLTACGDGGGDSPPQITDISGTWAGVASGTVGTVNINLTLTQQNADVTGSFACSPGTATCLHASGSVSGTVSGNTATMAVVFPDTHSCGAFNATVSGNSMSGNFSCTDPAGNSSGTWNVTRQ